MKPAPVPFIHHFIYESVYCTAEGVCKLFAYVLHSIRASAVLVILVPKHCSRTLTYCTMYMSCNWLVDIYYLIHTLQYTVLYK